MAKSEALDKVVTRLREGFGALGGMSLEEQRAFYDRAGSEIPIDADVIVNPTSAGGVPAEWIAAPNADRAVVLYLHGGGYVIGSVNSHRELCAQISRAAAARVLLLDYRLAPEHAFPAALDDALTAYRFLLDEGIAPSEIAIAGDSAGGGLTLALLMALRDAGMALPACAVTLSAWTDLAATGESLKTRADEDPFVSGAMIEAMAGTYLAGADSRHPHCSPLYGSFKGLPPLLMQVGTAETLLDDTLRVAEKARAEGVDVTVETYEDLFHVFQQLGGDLPERLQAIERIGAFIRTYARARTGAR